MEFFPKNRYLHVESTDVQNKEDSFEGFVLPADYKPQNTLIKVVKLLRASKDSEFVNNIDSLLLIPAHMIESLSYEGMKINIVSENAVYGILVKNE